MLGVYVNVINSAKCGSSCPTDRPLPVPYLNHNGFCHITEMLGAPFIFYAQKNLYNAVERDGANATTSKERGLEGKTGSQQETKLDSVMYGDGGAQEP